MPAEVLLDAVSSQVTGVPTEFTKIKFPNSSTADTDFYPTGTRSTQLYDSAVLSYFLRSFGRNSRTITCECERSTDPSVVQVLHLSNGDTINEKLARQGNRIDELLELELSNDALVRKAYLIALAREPTTKERHQLSELLAQAGDDEKRKALEDLFWGLLSSREFMFNH